jgi:hypothetical protein
VRVEELDDDYRPAELREADELRKIARRLGPRRMAELRAELSGEESSVGGTRAGSLLRLVSKALLVNADWRDPRTARTGGIRRDDQEDRQLPSCPCGGCGSLQRLV